MINAAQNSDRASHPGWREPALLDVADAPGAARVANDAGGCGGTGGYEYDSDP